MNRRDFVRTAGAGVTLTAIAGCMGGNGSGNGSGTKTTSESGHGTKTTTGSENGTQTTTGSENGSDNDGENFAFYEEIEAEVGKTPDNLKVLEQRLFRTAEGAGVMGRVKNVGENPYSYLEAEVTVYDDKGEVLFELVDESEEDDIKTFPPGAVWDFVVNFEEAKPKEIARYTLNFDGDVEKPDNVGTNSSE